MKVWPLTTGFWMAIALSASAAAQRVSFDKDSHNDSGQPIIITVSCPTASNTPLRGYVSEVRAGLARQNRPTIEGKGQLVILVPKDGWYKLAQTGAGCTATMATAPGRRFTR